MCSFPFYKGGRKRIREREKKENKKNEKKRRKREKEKMCLCLCLCVHERMRADESLMCVSAYKWPMLDVKERWSDRG